MTEPTSEDKAPQYSLPDLKDLASNGDLNEEAWQGLYHLAREEEIQTNEASSLSDIPASALIELAEKVRGEPDPIKRYELVSSLSPREGVIWFDVLETFSDKSSRDLIYDSLFLSADDRRRIVDLGTGTGNLAIALEDLADEVIGVDRVDKLLEVARLQSPDTIKYHQAEVFSTGLAEASFDLAVSLGLESSFTKVQIAALTQEVSRLLRNGGSYITTFNTLGDISEFASTAKGLLADCIVDTVSGKSALSNEDKWEYSDLESAFELVGMSLIESYENEDGSMIAVEFVKS